MNRAVSGSAVRMRRYRAAHRRIDFVPSPDVSAIIDQHLDAGLNNCLGGVLDCLVRAGHKALSAETNAVSARAGEKQA